MILSKIKNVCFGNVVFDMCGVLGVSCFIFFLERTIHIQQNFNDTTKKK